MYNGVIPLAAIPAAVQAFATTVVVLSVCAFEFVGVVAPGFGFVFTYVVLGG